MKLEIVCSAIICLLYNRHPATVTVIEILAVIGVVVWAAGYRLIRVRMLNHLHIPNRNEKELIMMFRLRLDYCRSLDSGLCFG